MTKWQRFQEWLDSGAAILTCIAVLVPMGLIFIQPAVPFTVAICAYGYSWMCAHLWNESKRVKRQYDLTK